MRATSALAATADVARSTAGAVFERATAAYTRRRGFSVRAAGERMAGGGRTGVYWTQVCLIPVSRLHSRLEVDIPSGEIQRRRCGSREREEGRGAGGLGLKDAGDVKWNF